MAEWRKAIPEERDRLQSKMLVWVVAPLLAVACLALIFLSLMHKNSGSDLYTFKALGLSLTFALLVWGVRAATLPGALCGSMVCFLVTLRFGRTDQPLWHSGLAPLIALFLLTFVATKAGRLREVRLGVAESRRGRSAAQVLANLGMAGLVAMHGAPALLIATLCEATADTVSSEFGQAFGGRPIVLTSLQRVEHGTDGAVSLLGSAAGILGAGIVAAVGMWSMSLQWEQALVGLAGGVAGWIFDSVLGATVERKGWLGNDLVNFSSTVFAVFAAVVLMILLK